MQPSGISFGPQDLADALKAFLNDKEVNASQIWIDLVIRG